MLTELATDELKLLEETGREVTRKCGCLPLPISVIGGILRQERTWSEWEKVCKNIHSYLQYGKGVEVNKRVKQVLDLSYDTLPYNLKPCFLYLGCFSEDQKIYTRDLYPLWMAEGMISSEDRQVGETLRDVAERYLSELENRCMVQVEMDERSTYNRFESCRLHDLMRDLCLSKGKDEKFLEVVDGQMERQDASSFSSRLAFHSDETKVDVEFGKLRSLLFFGGKCKNAIPTNFGKFKSLKILVLYGCRFPRNQLPEGIEKLILLKHLCIRESKVEELPASICKLPCLEDLDLETFDGSINLPDSINKTRRLRHLFVPHFSRSVIDGAKVKLDGLNELETMIGFNSSTYYTTHLVKLRKLRVFHALIFDGESLSLIVHHLLNNQDHYRETKFIIHTECNINIEQVDGSTLLTKILMCRSLCHLRIECHVSKISCYNNELQLGRNLLSLILCESFIEENPMEMLEKLPVLRDLQLHEDAFSGREMVCRAAGFPQLRYLYLYGLPNLVEWRVEEKAMPNLSSLQIGLCTKLNMIPEGLKFISTLKELQIVLMPKKFIDRARVVDGQPGEDYDKIKHIPSIELDYH